MDLGDLVGPRVTVAARKRQGMDHHTLEDAARLDQELVDDADAATAGVIHGGALGEGGNAMRGPRSMSLFN